MQEDKCNTQIQTARGIEYKLHVEANYEDSLATALNTVTPV